MDGQPAIILKDLTGREYPAKADIKRNKRVNGQREITLSFLYDEVNQEFIHDLEFGWEVLFDGEWYTITHPGYAADGDYMAVDVSAVLSFFVVMNGYYLQDKAEDKSMTAANYFRELFEGTPYTYVLVDHLGSNTLSYQDNQSKTERFLYGIDRFGGEYTIRDRVAYIYEMVGSDKDVILHEDLNVADVKIDVDASGFHTWAKGFGDLPEGEEDADYQLEVEYVSPLVDKYGYIEGPAIKDGKYKHEDTLIEAVKNQVENSYTISTEVTAIDLTNNGYPEMRLEEGDRVWLVVDRLGLNQQVRVMEIEETFDWEGNIIDVRYTLGNEGIASRYKTQQYNSISDFRDIQSGRKKLEYDWLPDAVRRASYIINGNEDSRFFYRRGEIIGINENNPNGYMRFNTDGIGFSRDGGKTYRTAITYEGIVADAITTGTLRGIVIEGVEIYGTDIYGGYIHSMNNNNTYWDLSSGELRMQRANITLGSGANIEFTNRNNRLFYTNNNVYAGIQFDQSLGETTNPMIGIGVSDGSHNVNDRTFRGIRIHSLSAEGWDNERYGVNVISQNFRVYSLADLSGSGFEFRLHAQGGPRGIFPVRTGTFTYDLGRHNNRWRDLWIDRLRTGGDGSLIIRDGDGNGGYRFDTRPQNDGYNATFRGESTNDNSYNIGNREHRFSYIYLKYEPSILSDARLKEDIHHNKLGLDFILDLETKSFRLMPSGAEKGKNKTEYGFLAQQVIDTLISHNVDVEDTNMIDQSNDGIYGVKTTQLIAPAIKAVQEFYADYVEYKEEINKRLERLENGATT